MSDRFSRFKVGDKALSREGRPLTIVSVVSEDDVLFAWVRYDNGYMPYPNVNGRVAGTEADPLWEHRVYDGEVVKSGGDYWNPDDWTIEKGLEAIA